MPDFSAHQEENFPEGFWERINKAILETARKQLVGRRILSYRWTMWHWLKNADPLK